MSATSSSIQIPGEGQNWHRNAARVPNWQSPGIHNSQLSLGPISTRYGGEPLDDDNLSEIAEFFLELDLTALDLVEEIVVKNGGRVVPDLPTQQKIQAIQDELHLIQNRQYHFHEDFLRNTVLSHCAERGLFILEAMIGEPALQHKLGDEGHKTFPKMTRQLSGVPRMIVNAASHGSLSPDLRRALRRLWVKVDELSELLVKSKHLDPGDALPRWPEIITTINSVVPHKLKKDEGGSVNNRTRSLDSILWATFTSNVCLTIPFLWKAYEFSSHLPGTQGDADYWFLIQSCVSQLIGLFISSIGLWRQSRTSIWA